jgi:aryl-alcohol dehydrogenase-like predicted oxidoreductase
VPRFSEENRKANQKIVVLLAEIAMNRKATSAQIALAWLLAQKPWIVPIPGTTKMHRLLENIGSVSLELSTNEIDDITQAFASIPVHGARYPQHLAARVGK